jgi:hypothetical protein
MAAYVGETIKELYVHKTCPLPLKRLCLLLHENDAILESWKAFFPKPFSIASAFQYGISLKYIFSPSLRRRLEYLRRAFFIANAR